jgi:hypothetical protein
MPFDEIHRTEGLAHAHSVIISSTDDAAALAIAGFVIILLSGDQEAASNAEQLQALSKVELDFELETIGLALSRRSGLAALSVAG